MWLRRIVFFSWMPGLVTALMVYLFERSLAHGDQQAAVYSSLVDLMLERTDRVAWGEMAARSAELAENLTAFRHQFWCSLLQLLYQRSHGLILIFIVGITAPPLISQDIRSRAFLLYFSRPISRTQYILGKAAVVGCYLLSVSLLPGLVLYITGVLLSPDISIVLETWDIPLRVLAVTAVMVIPTTCLGLMLSSLTTEARFASFAWFTVWIFGLFSAIVADGLTVTGGQAPLEMLSLFHMISDMQLWLLDVRSETTADPAEPLSILVTVTVVSLAVLYRRVSASLKV